MINVTSTFPTSPDVPGYWSDVNIAQKATMDQYNAYIAAGEYSKAYALISESNIFGWFADYMNAIENRILALQTFLSDTLTVKHPDQCMYNSTEPTVFKDQNSERALAVDNVWVTNAV